MHAHVRANRLIEGLEMYTRAREIREADHHLPRGAFDP